MAKKVLVIDDDPSVLKFLSLALEENGYEPLCAEDGMEGFEKVKSETPDLIILDVMMPKRTGFVLFRQLRKSDEYKDIPVMMVTAVAGSLREQDEKKEGTFDSPYDELRETLRKAIQKMRDEGLVKPEMFLDKPIDPEDVIEKIRDLIGD
ncbi:MAG: response regulator [Planctomycetota bacterium]|jgi:two-component system alkaline phosphatase synthesis response regulator PhoP